MSSPMEKLAKVEGINEQTTMGEITNKYPGARRALFARYHIGGCSSCAYQDAETLVDVCARNSITSEEVMDHILNSHAEDKKMLIDPLAAKELLDQGKEVRFVDTRTREEHEAVAIPDSYFMTQGLQQEIFSKWDRSDKLTIILYDHTGKSALDTCAWFIGHEMKNSLALVGGIDAWSQQADQSISRYKLEM
ncbi:MAG: rhodanese-related sulfurtransferase [Cryomorphaceae bacterium]|jgi:rhodanese-related sulfurtransferase